ncbi:hypothetical protein AMES_7006 [Amycolatopsis mediterranei S699]|uniref:Uncharacterized protein n=1 Tax=Amycolatopsis mediterranei (strain U-32) TaxID=749927 RepID=A0A0H3DDR3_AMYMU|nr:hypothetical protein AMED_7113 [Amycolatopsis mediterranei U32]AFO80541.1 hypothetical protein AMES_7006 [Amycolatopsis mediterranei S699]AGT87669.1 hypothetical protein B737_7006 [Amycolatopsis mediterranei RB]KDU94057.1 hypothetical protein DV36_01580 [Amycolatopsis mediterranei]
MIYVDPQAVHPVINGEWHRLAGVLRPGQEFTTLCGISDIATFLPLSERRTREVPRQCDSCDVTYRRDHGIPLQQDRLRGADLRGRRQQAMKAL